MTRLTATFLDTRPQPLPGSVLPLCLPRGGGECPARLCLVAVVAVVSVLPVLRLGGSADQTAGLPEEGGLWGPRPGLEVLRPLLLSSTRPLSQGRAVRRLQQPATQRPISPVAGGRTAGLPLQPGLQGGGPARPPAQVQLRRPGRHQVRPDRPQALPGGKLRGENFLHGKLNITKLTNWNKTRNLTWWEG